VQRCGTIEIRVFISLARCWMAAREHQWCIRRPQAHRGG